MEFVNKGFFLLLLLLIPYIIWYLMFRKKSEPTMRMSDTNAYRYAPRSWKVTLMPLQMLLRMAAFVLIVIVLARPQTSNSWKDRTVEGIDIMLAMDVSTSMLAEDLSPNRIEAAKKVAAEFIADRPNDNIGLTIFAGESFTQCPMTIDHASLLNLLHNVRADIAARGLIQDGTAIGMGLANAVARLKDSKAKSKVVILLTDGSNNMGDISPMTAAEIAKSMGIRVYTIGAGTNGTARYPMPVGNGSKLCYGCNGSEYVRDMRHSNKLCFLCKQLLILMKNELSCFITGDDLYYRACFLSYKLPGNYIGMMLEDGNNYLVSRL